MLNSVHLPNRTVLQCGVAALLSLLLMSWLRIRPLGVIFLGLFGFWIYQTRCNLRIVAPPDLQTKYEGFVQRVRAWRQAQPAMFCAVTSVTLGLLAVLGHFISGSTVVLVGLVVAAIVSTKYNFKIVKVEPKDFDWSKKLQLQPDLDEEFMPDVNESNLFVLERASELATISSPIECEADEEEEKSDEVPSELLIPDVIPEINENTTDEDEDDELLVPISKKDKQQQQQQQMHAASSESNYQITKTNTTATKATEDVIQFKKRHFKRDSSLSTSSSSSEESLSKGLQFPDHTQVDAPRLRQITDGSAAASRPHNQPEASDFVAMAVKTQTQALLANSGKLIPSLVSGLVQWSMGGGGGGSGVAAANNSESAAPEPAAVATTNRRMVTALDSSDDSDFEILESEDFN